MDIKSKRKPFREPIDALNPDNWGCETNKDYVATATNHLKTLNNVKLNIGVMGGKGVGKSTFINAFLGLKEEGMEEAPQGPGRHTYERKAYESPKMSNVVLWDLPGIGGADYDSKIYLEKVKVHDYDMFIMLVSDDLKENDVVLIDIIKKERKPIHFARTKVDNDVKAEMDKSEEEILILIRQDLKIKMKKIGKNKLERKGGNLEIHLISSKYPQKYDFEKLCSSLENDLDMYKMLALQQALPVYSLEDLKKKTRNLRLISDVIAVGLGATEGILKSLTPTINQILTSANERFGFHFLPYCERVLGLDDESLKIISEKMDVSVESLKSVRKAIELEKNFKTNGESKCLDLSLDPIKVVSNICVLLANMGKQFMILHCILWEAITQLENNVVDVLEKAGVLKKDYTDCD